MTKKIVAMTVLVVALFSAATVEHAEACYYSHGAIICGSGEKAGAKYSDPGPRGGDVDAAPVAPTPISTHKSPQNFTKG